MGGLKQNEMIETKFESQKHEKGRYRGKQRKADRPVMARFMEDDFKKIEAYCKANEITLSQCMREAVRDYLTRQSEASESN
jgi:hypothetical protein